MKKRIIIIGGGIAGLSSGIYAQMNGYETEIFEMHSLPGGLCTSWKRGEFTIDGCIHWLVGSAGNMKLNGYLNEVGALKDRTFVYQEIFTIIETAHPDDPRDKRNIIFYSDAERLCDHLKAIAPEDSAEIDNFTSLIRKFSTFDFASDKPAELMGFSDFMRMMKSMKPYMSEFNKYSKLTIKDYSLRFNNPHLRQAICQVLNMPDFAFLPLVMSLGWIHAKSAGYPIGGSLDFSRSIEKKYLSLGGVIHYKSNVEKILVERNRATGIRLTDKSEYRADLVISAADGYSTIFRMLAGRFVNKKIRNNYETLPLFQPLFVLSLGVKRDLSKEPHAVLADIRILERPIHVENTTHTKIGIKHFCYDPTVAPKGKSVIEIMYTSDYHYWKDLYSNPPAYKAEKERVANTLIDALEQFLPGIRNDIEMTDTATPVTFERYTGNRLGTFEGWMVTPKTMMMTMKKTLPGLKNFYMTGQWVQPGGGVSTSLKSGRDLVYLLCHKDRKFFTVQS